MQSIARDVYKISVMPRSSINVYLIEDYLIDAAIRSSAKTILNQLKGRRLTAHVLTHAHADHQGSSREICETLQIPLWCSEPEKPQAESGNATKEYPFQNHIVTRFQRQFWQGPGHPVARTLKEGDRLGDFTVVETPGHSSGHLSFFRESDGVLIVGDVLTNMNLVTTLPGLHEPPGLFTMDRERNLQSIRKLAALQPRILCFGHGPVLINKGELARFVRTLSGETRK